MHEVIETTKKVSNQNCLVRIDPDAASRFARSVINRTLAVPAWDTCCHYEGPEETMVSYILVLDAVNFCFWPEKGRRLWKIDVGGRQLSGYYGLAAALKQACAAGVPLTNARFLANFSLLDLKTLLGGNGSLQLLEERVRCINELGKSLITYYDGQATRLIEAAQGSAVTLARLMAKQFPSFDDRACYKNETVYFYKRAQILAADLHGAFNGSGWGRFSDIDQLTAFADYKLPQVLRSLGILRYCPELSDKIDHHKLLVPGGPEEVEIRANTIWAVEMICRDLRRTRKDLSARDIDRLLWNMGQEKPYRKKPYHRTRTIYY